MNDFGVFLDLDGTLIDSLPDICGNVNAVRRSLALPELTNPEIRRWIGQGVEYLIAGSFPERPASQIPELVAAYQAQYRKTPCHGGGAFPGVAETLAEFQRRGYKLAIVTNKATRSAEQVAALYLPTIRFDDISGPERVTRKKPAPHHLLEVMGRVGVAPANACFVGDDPVDAECAAAAGVRFFAATYGIGGVSAAPEARLATFPELLAKLSPGIRPTL